jgi:hypothetical protein
MEKIWMAHQGDVFIRQIREFPAGVKPVETKDRIVLAESEVTGHAHAIHRGAVMFRADEGIGAYLQVKESGADVVHEEHATIALPAGLYEVTIQSQYEPEAIRNVID